MKELKPEQGRALAFAHGWIARNIEAGPFSSNDPAICDIPTALFRAEAARAGFNEAELEEGIGGAVPAFIERAYAEAVSNWHTTRKT